MGLGVGVAYLQGGFWVVVLAPPCFYFVVQYYFQGFAVGKLLCNFSPFEMLSGFEHAVSVVTEHVEWTGGREAHDLGVVLLT